MPNPAWSQNLPPREALVHLDDELLDLDVQAFPGPVPKRNLGSATTN